MDGEEGLELGASVVVDVVDNVRRESVISGDYSQTDDFIEQSEPYEVFMDKKLAIAQTLELVHTNSWEFQSQVDKKARTHLANILSDFWTKDVKYGISYTDDLIQRDLGHAVKRCFKDMFFQYKKWCKVTGQDNLTKQIPEKDTDGRIRAMLLLLMIYGEIDVIRSQNHAVMLLFQATYTIVILQTKVEPTFTVPTSLSRMRSQTLLRSKSVKELRQYESAFDIKTSSFSLNDWGEDFDENVELESERKQSEEPVVQKERNRQSCAFFVKTEAEWLYNLMLATYDKSKRNDEFFDWDDLNDLCWTPGFVKDFLSHPEIISNSDWIQFSGFQTAFKMHHFPILNSKAKQCSDPNIDKDMFQHERDVFKHMWKTYFDAAGGLFGWRGYLTFLLGFSLPLVYQLVCLSASMLWLFGSLVKKDYVFLVFSLLPVAFAIMILILKYSLRWRVAPRMSHPHRFGIPRRDDVYRRSELKQYSWMRRITGHIAKWFLLHEYSNILMMFAVTVVYVVVLRFLLLQNIKTLTVNAITLMENMITGKQRILMREVFSVLISYLSFMMLWVSCLSVWIILPPIIMNTLVGIVGFIHGLVRRVNAVQCWSDLRQVMQGNRKTIVLENFARSCMAMSQKAMKQTGLKKIEKSFGLVWNLIVEDLYDNHMVSQEEKERLSYDFTKKENPQPDLAYTPVNATARRQLQLFVNSLFSPNMPRGKAVNVIDMKRLVVFTPVYKEKIFYSWEELVKPCNTNSSFLRALILQNQSDWRNFKNKEFPRGSRLRTTVDYIEAKVLAGIDVTAHQIHSSTTTEYIRKKIRAWASQRFQPVSRTVKGFMKIAKALSILLRIQHPHLSSEQVKNIVTSKFSYVCGAQLFDKNMWLQATGHAKKDALSQKLNLLEYEDYVWGLKELSKTAGSNMFKVAFMRFEEDPVTKKKLYKAVLSCGDSESIFEVENFGDFSNTGYGKPANQMFMMQFFDGSFCQAIDCNMDCTLSQALFVPNLLQEFDNNPQLSILGFPEYVFTASWSKAGYAAAFTERVFGALIQRVWSLLGMRFHYGHPDILRGLFVMFTTGTSKLSYVSEDVFTGFDTMLNNGLSQHVDYFEVGKARDVDMITTTKFNRKISGGASQLCCSRYPHWVMTSRHYSLSRKLLFAYSVMAHYTNALCTVISIFALYSCRVLILILQRINKKSAASQKVQDLITSQALDISGAVTLVADSLFFFQLGAVLALPGILQHILDRGLLRGIYEYLKNLVYLFGYALFQLMNTAFYFHYGFNSSVSYIASGRGSGLEHTSILDINRMFNDSHFIPATIMIVLQIVSVSVGGSIPFLIYHFFICFVFLYAPLLFNEGSFPVTILYETWAKLYAEDNYRIKTWLQTTCNIDQVEQIIAKNRYQRLIQMEYDLLVDDSTEQNLELDLEVSMAHRGAGSFFDKARKFSIDMKRKFSIADPESFVTLEEEVTPVDESEKKWRKYWMFQEARSRFFIFFIAQPIHLARELLRAIPKLICWMLLYGTKILSYLYLLYKVIAPWTSPPNYAVAYLQEYKDRTTESRLINIQRMFLLYDNEFTGLRNEVAIATNNPVDDTREAPDIHDPSSIVSRPLSSLRSARHRDQYNRSSSYSESPNNMGRRDSSAALSQYRFGTPSDIHTPLSQSHAFKSHTGVFDRKNSLSPLSPNFRRGSIAPSPFAQSLASNMKYPLGNTPYLQTGTPRRKLSIMIPSSSSGESGLYTSSLSKRKLSIMIPVSDNQVTLIETIPSTRNSNHVNQHKDYNEGSEARGTEPKTEQQLLFETLRTIVSTDRTFFDKMRDFAINVSHANVDKESRKQFYDLATSAFNANLCELDEADLADLCEKSNRIMLLGSETDILFEILTEQSSLEEINEIECLQLSKAFSLFGIFRDFDNIVNQAINNLKRVDVILNYKAPVSTYNSNSFSTRNDKTISPKRPLPMKQNARVPAYMEGVNEDNKFERALECLIGVADLLTKDNKTFFETVMSSDEDYLEFIAIKCQNILEAITTKLVTMSQRYFSEAKKDFDHFSAVLESPNLFIVGSTDQEKSKCYACEVMRLHKKSLHTARDRAIKAMIFAARLTEEQGNSVEQSYERILQHEFLFDDDDGQALFDQAFPFAPSSFAAIDSNQIEDQLQNISSPEVKQISQQIAEMAQDRNEIVNFKLSKLLIFLSDKLIEKVSAQQFLSLEADTAEMIELLNIKEEHLRQRGCSHGKKRTISLPAMHH
jgi:hypothetical protein